MSRELPAVREALCCEDNWGDLRRFPGGGHTCANLATGYRNATKPQD